ncbi:hypothetical protein KY348_07105 [Candidatus Woesearchaeota archaeon]|nr:hypothetical protein [Candidatus Woesearchaeota archaeon]
MSVEIILQHYQENNPKDTITEIDVIGVYQGGREPAEKVAERLNNETNLSTRLLFIYPMSKKYGKNFFGFKAEFYYNYCIGEKLIPEDTTFKDFVYNPFLRFFKDNPEKWNGLEPTKPKPENLAIVVDDQMQSGDTLRFAILDIMKIGYKQSKLYYCIKHHAGYGDGVWYAGDFGDFNDPTAPYWHVEISKEVL